MISVSASVTGLPLILPLRTRPWRSITCVWPTVRASERVRACACACVCVRAPDVRDFVCLEVERASMRGPLVRPEAAKSKPAAPHGDINRQIWSACINAHLCTRTRVHSSTCTRVYSNAAPREHVHLELDVRGQPPRLNDTALGCDVLSHSEQHHRAVRQGIPACNQPPLLVSPPRMSQVTLCVLGHLSGKLTTLCTNCGLLHLLRRNYAYNQTRNH